MKTNECEHRMIIGKKNCSHLGTHNMKELVTEVCPVNYRCPFTWIRALTISPIS